MKHIPLAAQWINRGTPSRVRQREPFPGPRPKGKCMVPPRGILFKDYKSLIHGPLVECFYDTAGYFVSVPKEAND